MSEVRSARRRGGKALLAPFLALLCATATAATATAAPQAPTATDRAARPVVRTDHGAVRGTAHGAYATYQGIPYAAPPTGPLRWRAPEPARSWQGVRDAGAPGPKCAQLEASGSGQETRLTGSEDCLYLNVTTPTARPAERAGKNRPVMVWVHGGGFTSGSGSDYAAEQLAVQGDVVVVTVNYRLGMLGFFGHPELGRSGDFGLADQQAALRWVRANAARFGGNPRNVTLFGESAGGLSTCAQLSAPGAAGLFHKAVIQSGPCALYMPRGSTTPGSPAGGLWTSQAAAQATGTETARRLGCPRAAEALSCLRALPLSRLVTPELTSAFSKVAYGNAVLPLEPQRALERGRFQRVPVVQGTNHDEMRLFVGLTLADQPIPDERAYRARLRDSFGTAAGAVEKEYPAAAYPSPALAWSALLTDRAWACTALRTDRALAGHVPLYGYEFNDPHAPNPLPLPAPKGFPYGASHAFELPYLFSFPQAGPLTDQQRRLSQQMIGYWTRFAHTGDPNGKGAPRWARLGSGRPLVQSLAPGRGGIKPVDLGAEHHCGFWSRHGA
ncbi:carboxylesterase/lipase family protein [Streptomyces gamaensis]|uniref:Carboxylic ester hydrolase n=1 Tax=Streptomyces gamaensis TaxID=1763542 RepID=A0ABW0ZCM1_9ACTN